MHHASHVSCDARRAARGAAVGYPGGGGGGGGGVRGGGGGGGARGMGGAAAMRGAGGARARGAPTRAFTGGGDDARGLDAGGEAPAASAYYETLTAGFKPCPHCGRTFNENAWARHVPRCKETIARPKPPPGMAAAAAAHAAPAPSARRSAASAGPPARSRGGGDTHARGSGIAAAHAIAEARRDGFFAEAPPAAARGGASARAGGEPAARATASAPPPRSAGATAAQDWSRCSVGQLKQEIAARGLSAAGAIEKSDLVRLLEQPVRYVRR